MGQGKKLVPQLRFPEFDGEWEMKKLGEIAEFSKGKGISKSDINENGEVECIRYGELYTMYGETIEKVNSKTNVNMSHLVLSEENDVIIPASGETQIDIATASCVLKSGIALGSDLNIIRAKCNGVFLSYYLNSKKRIKIARLAQGISVVHLYSSQLSLLELNIPLILEQEKISNFLTIVDSRILILDKKKKLLEQYKKGVMQRLFAPPLSEIGMKRLEDDTNPLKKNENPTILKSKKSKFRQLRFKDDDGMEYPEWEFKNGNLLFKSISNKNHNSDLPILAVTQDKGAIPRDLIDYNIGVTEKSVRSYKIVQVGDFIISLRSFQGGIEYSNYKGICSPAYIILGPIEEMDRNFYRYYLKTSTYITKLNKKLEGIRDGKMISYKYFSEIELPYPSLPEQTKIANSLTAIDKKIELVDSKIEKAREFKKGLLQQMFV